MMMRIFKQLLFCTGVFLLISFSNTLVYGQEGAAGLPRNSGWRPSVFELQNEQYQTYILTRLSLVFPNEKNRIVKISKELEGLTGIKIPAKNGIADPGSFKFKLAEQSKVLIGIFRDSSDNQSASYLSNMNFHDGKLIQQPVLKNALSITAMPSLDVYAVTYQKGNGQMEWKNSSFLLLGVIKTSQGARVKDAALPDGRLWENFSVEGFSDQKPLFEVIGGEPRPVVDEGMSGTEDIQGGFEGGACVKVGDTYHMFPTERAGQKGMEPAFDRVKTRIGHWTSKDAVHWKRQSTIYQASGNYALTHDDNPLNDRRGAIWSYMPVYNEKANKWYGYYLTYTVDREIAPNHSFGRIWRTESETPGRAGIGGPYKAGVVIMEPGLDTQLWEGRQGVDSFYPFQVGKEWLALYGGAYPYQSRQDYPDKPGTGWFVGLAKSKTAEGPWTRMDTTVNPIRTIHPWFIENPIIYKLKDIYITMFDGGPEGWGHHLPNMMGYSLSVDGIHWSAASYLPIEIKVKKWWDMMRTPMCLIDEGDHVYTVVYAAINNNKRFHPLGKVRLKLNSDVLAQRVKELTETK